MSATAHPSSKAQFIFHAFLDRLIFHISLVKWPCLLSLPLWLNP